MNKEYIDKHRAAKTLGISPRRLAELAAAGKINRHYTNDPKSRKQIVVFKRDDLSRLAKERLEPVPPAGTMRALAAPGTQGIAIFGQKLKEYMGAMGGDGSQAIAYPHLRQWLTVAEAADYTGLPATFIVELIQNANAKRKAPRLPAFDVGVRPGGRWRIAKRDLDALSADPK